MAPRRNEYCKDKNLPVKRHASHPAQLRQGQWDRNNNSGSRNSDDRDSDQTTKNDPDAPPAIDYEQRTLDIEEFIQRMVASSELQLRGEQEAFDTLYPGHQDLSSMDAEDIKLWMARNKSTSSEYSPDTQSQSTALQLSDSESSMLASRSKDVKKKKKSKKQSDSERVHERRMLYRPSPFLTYILPKEYVSIPPASNLPAYPHNRLPFPWGVRLPLPKSQRNSPDLPQCSPLPLFPPENIIAFSYQHSSKHYQMCADSKAEHNLEWL